MIDTMQLGTTPADFSNIDLLEEKINKTIELVHKLRAENNELKKYNSELINRIQEKERLISKLEDDYNNLKEQKDSSEYYKNRDVKIQQKVEDIITKLENLHNLDSKF